MDNIDIEVSTQSVDLDILAQGFDGELGRNNPTVFTVKSYGDLDDKPQINDVTLIGNKSFDDLGLPALTNTEIDEIVRRLLS